MRRMTSALMMMPLIVMFSAQPEVMAEGGKLAARGRVAHVRAPVADPDPGHQPGCIGSLIQD